jgi:hypothetical protein
MRRQGPQCLAIRTIEAAGAEVPLGWPAEMPQADLASVNYTWGRIARRLKRYTETGKPAPFFA